MDLPIQHAHSAKESAVLGGVAPQVDGVNVKPIPAREHHACDAGAGSEVAYARPFRKVNAAKQLFAELKRVGPHDFGANEIDIEAICLWESIHCFFLFIETILKTGSKRRNSIGP